jgi:6,7-dimethyl-8-ribityllumazine synthase
MGTAKYIECVGACNGEGLKIGIAVARFNQTVTESLLAGAVDMLVRLGVAETDLTVAWVPGAFELPGVVSRMLDANKYDAVIALGAVIRGETPHFDQVVSATTSGIAQQAAQGVTPVLFGVLTTDTVEQAMDRSGLKGGNKGAETAMAAVEMARLYAQI